MIKYLLVLLLVVNLSGCGAETPKPEIIYKTINVSVPVYTVPEFNIPAKPLIEKDALTMSDKGDYTKIIRAWILSVSTLETYSQKLLNILEGLNEKKDTTVPQ